jgi:signal transduction histidine kinase
MERNEQCREGSQFSENNYDEQLDDSITDSSETSSSFSAVRYILFSNINYKLEFSDEKLKEQYYLFRTATTSPSLALGIAVVVLVCYIIYWSFVFHVDTSPFPIIIASLSFIIAIVFFWILIYLRCTTSLADQQSKFKQLLVTLESCLATGIVTTTGLVLLMRSLRICSSVNFSERWSCTPNYYSIPADVSVVLMFSPLIFSVVFPFLPFSVVYSCEFIATAFIISIVTYKNAYGSAVLVAFLILLSLFLLIVYRLQQMELFLYTTKYYQALKEQARQERRMASQLSNEMKSLISGVSHDLKSVSWVIMIIFLNFILCIFSLFPLSFKALKV